MSYYLLTIRYHNTNNDYFEDFIPFFLNYIKNFKHITSIEKDGTTDRHLHSFLELQEYGKDRDAITGKLNTAFKSKISKLKQTATRYDKKMRMKGTSFILNNKEKTDELYYRLGYVLKENPVRLYHNGFTDTELEDYKINYIRFKQLENKKPENVDNFTHLTIKNVIPKCFDYIRKHKKHITMTEYGTNLQFLMEKDGYIFIEISEKHMKYLRRFIRLHFYDQYEDIIEKEIFWDDPEMVFQDDIPRHILQKQIETLKLQIKRLQKENSEKQYAQMMTETSCDISATLK